MDRGVAGYAESILRKNIVASPQLTEELSTRVMGVLRAEFKALATLSEIIGTLEHDLDMAASSPITITERAMARFENVVGTIKEGDDRFAELLLESELIERYEGLIHPDRRAWAASELRGELWGGVPHIDAESETPIADLFEQCVNYVSTRASKVLGAARSFGITA
ncbi:MAG: hypothetical protein JRE40_15090 [Deltaproteobacteria bacterium]|nr:hypothetical protein [Deltaproteobacteria bacterium]